MKKGKYAGTAGMPMPKKGGGPKGPDTVSNGGDMSKNMGGVSLKPTTQKGRKSGY